MSDSVCSFVRKLGPKRPKSVVVGPESGETNWGVIGCNYHDGRVNNFRKRNHCSEKQHGATLVWQGKYNIDFDTHCHPVVSFVVAN